MRVDDVACTICVSLDRGATLIARLLAGAHTRPLFSLT